MPKKASDDSSVGFVSLDGELYLLSLLNGNDSPESRRSRQHKSLMTILVFIKRCLREHVIEQTRTVRPPSPNGCTWVGSSGGRPCRSSVSEKNFAGHIMAAPPPPPPLAADNAYPEQRVQFGMASDRI
ncbi:F-box kelch-repeat OR23 [Olea europaea subsp. europaea]|uniref:F-box kelch-repeat OR23 n=1 Tax=Olea europaea subsp. europaea TaxID=158383 RepID=A0A8S0UPD5_OLEEU|nr:F-box kelch-repeat OR23 [Olea europaea subsp. europaea]